MCSLGDLACAQDDTEEQYADTDSKEEVENLQNSPFSEETDIYLEWSHKLPSDKVEYPRWERTKWAKQNRRYQYFWKYTVSRFIFAVFSNYSTS
jgi:hypothetical protein